MTQANMSRADYYLSEVQKTNFFQGKEVEGSFESSLEWCRKGRRWRKFPYQGFGLIVIILGAALPLVAAYGESLNIQNKGLWVSILASLMGLMAGLNSFLRPDVGWRGVVEAELALQSLRGEWELAITKAKTHPDSEEGLKIITDATEQFQRKARGVIEAESRGYFSLQTFPGVKAELTTKQ